MLAGLGYLGISIFHSNPFALWDHKEVSNPPLGPFLERAFCLSIVLGLPEPCNSRKRIITVSKKGTYKFNLHGIHSDSIHVWYIYLHENHKNQPFMGANKQSSHGSYGRRGHGIHCEPSKKIKKSPAGPTEWTPQPEYLIALATYLGVRW